MTSEQIDSRLASAQVRLYEADWIVRMQARAEVERLKKQLQRRAAPSSAEQNNSESELTLKQNACEQNKPSRCGELHRQKMVKT